MSRPQDSASPSDLGDEPAAASAELFRDDETDEPEDTDVGEMLDDLPELEGDDEEESGADAGVIELDDLDDGGPAGQPEREASELDVGSDSEDLFLPSASEDGEDDSEGVEETAPLVVELSESSALADGAEGLEENDDDLPALPGLDRGDDAEGVKDGGVLPANSNFADEDRPARGVHGLVEVTEAPALEACTALSTAEAITVAASTDLFWFDRGELTPVRLEAGSSHIHAVALVGTEWEYAVCATSNGKLFRRGRLASASEELRRLRDVTESTAGAREVFSLCQPGARFPHSLLVLGSSGRLLRSDDDGLSFRRVTERKILALAPSGAPVFALASGGGLLRSEDGGGVFSELALSGLALEAVSASPLLAARGEALALATPLLGVLVSADGGATFRRVAGTQGVTALCVAEPEREAGPVVFAALHEEAHDRALIICIQARTGEAELVHELDAPLVDDAEEADLSRVAHLTWDDAHNRLWAAGPFGVKNFSRPAAH